jgi:hypothetical protein
VARAVAGSQATPAGQDTPGWPTWSGRDCPTPRSRPSCSSALFISRKAVEYHLGNIYAKCGVPGRQQLRRLVEQ